MNVFVPQDLEGGGALVPLPEQQQALRREAGKIDRRFLEDQAKAFATYVGSDGQRSSQPKWVYRNLTKMIYRALGLDRLEREAKKAGINVRDWLDPHNLDILASAERTVAETLQRGMAQNLPRQEIKKNIKKKLARCPKADVLAEEAKRLSARTATTVGRPVPVQPPALAAGGDH